MTLPGLDAARQIDDQLFVGPYVLIDRDNRSAGSAPSRMAAEAAVQEGRAATYAAHVRDEVAAIDIDLPDHGGGLADYLIEEIQGWSDRRGLVCVTRLSGGGPARRHVYIAGGAENLLSEPTRAELARLIDLIRQERRLKPAQIELRRIIRPLTAPHRRTGDRQPPADLTSIAGVAMTWPRQESRRRRGQPSSVDPGEAVVDSRTRAAVDQVVRDATGDRSLDEFALTRALVNQGASLETAWAAVVSLGGKSAERGASWWRRHIWAKVRPAALVSAPASTDLSRVILPTVAKLRPRLLALDRRQRHTVETVCWVVLERLQEHPEQWLPISERDLELTTGLTRRAARGALRWLLDAGVLNHRRGHRKDDAKEWILGPQSVLSPNAPPRLTPSARHWAPGCPTGTASSVLDSALPPHLRPASPHSTRQHALETARQQAASDRGLLPTREFTSDSGSSGSRVTARQHDQAIWSQCLERVTLERDAFYAHLREARTTRDQLWHSARAEAFRRDRDRQQRWWRSLPATERDRRREQHRARHRGLPAPARATACEQLRRRRAIRATGGTPLRATGGTPHLLPHLQQHPQPGSPSRLELSSLASLPDSLLAPERDSGLTCS